MPIRLVPPDGKTKRLAPVRPNVGIEAEYRRRLDALIAEMHASLVYWIRAQWRENTPHMATDASPAWDLAREMKRLGSRWLRRIDEAAPKLAAWFATAAKDRADGALKAILKRAGMTVKFKLTKEVNDIFQATLTEQVNLIKSIGTEHLTQVAGIVNRSVQTGRDLGTLAKGLEHQFGVTKRRAAFIASSQNNIATATITRARQLEIGITQAVWLHSAGGRVPRKSHVANSGKPYDVAKGWFDPDAKVWTHPGVLPRCRCVSKPIVAGFS